jgi:hypothetical protein
LLVVFVCFGFFVVVVVAAAEAHQKKHLRLFFNFPENPDDYDMQEYADFPVARFFVLFASETSLLCYFSGAKSFFHRK